MTCATENDNLTIASMSRTRLSLFFAVIVPQVSMSLVADVGLGFCIVVCKGKVSTDYS